MACHVTASPPGAGLASPPARGAARRAVPPPASPVTPTAPATSPRGHIIGRVKGQFEILKLGKSTSCTIVKTNQCNIFLKNVI